MIILKKKIDLVHFIASNKLKGLTIGFVPTMGALHSGHLSLINQAKNNTDLVVCSIFVNPTQFNDPKDFEKYPITIEQDIYLLEKADCTLLFLPPVQEVYPEGLNAASHFELGVLEAILDGQYRPGHFQGVCRVMDRLLSIVQPDKLFMGQKDYQQCMVLKMLISDRFPAIQFVMCATLRELDGLAMSSRNVRLNEKDRQQAVKIYEGLQYIKEHIKKGDLSSLKSAVLKNLTDQNFKVDYVEMANSNTLQLVEHWNGKDPLVALIAGFLGDVRLIDNLILIK